MTVGEHRRLDDATVWLMERTSHRGDPRTYLADCRGCGRPFWVTPEAGQHALHCSVACRSAAWYRRNRTQRLAHQRAYARRRSGVAS